VVVYKTNPLSFSIAKRLIKVAHISLVNLVLGKEAVRELIQGECTTANVTQELKQIIEGGSKRPTVMADYDVLQKVMGTKGASARAGTLMVKYLREIKGLPETSSE
jgi:lipid-A-disaccharide synthase